MGIEEVVLWQVCLLTESDSCESAFGGGLLHTLRELLAIC